MIRLARHLRPLRALALASIGAALCAGCSTFAYTVDRYGRSNAVQMHLGCHDTYEVYDRPDALSMLVGTNALNETLAGVCDDAGAGALPREERLRRVARLFLDEPGARPDCRIVRATSVTAYATEFDYRCPAPPAAPATPATPGRRASRR